MKVLVIGIDALDSLVLDRLIDQLPNFKKLMESFSYYRVVSTFPPDSDTAWATIVTGMNPAEHGIVKFVDPLEKSYQLLNKRTENRALAGNTFWDAASNAGYKAAAIFPHLCFPVWEIKNGVMVSRASTTVDPEEKVVQSSSEGYLDLYPDPGILDGVRGFPDRGYKGMLQYAKNIKHLTASDAEFALRVMQKENWDLFFVYFSTIDAIGHFFWNYFDKDDPNFKEGNPLQNVIPEIYKLYDDIVERFLSKITEDTEVIILSDHGHGARPLNLVNVNEVLRQNGLLVTSASATKISATVFEKVKRLSLKFISRFGLGKLAGRIMRNFPGAVQSFTRPSMIDWENTTAYATDMSGIKAYTYGGIMINQSAILEDTTYEEVRSKVIKLIEDNCKLPGGTSLVKFICRREELNYEGPYLDKYPDIVMEFKYGYGVGWAINVPLLTQAASYNLVPGSHRGDTGVCFIKSKILRESQSTVNLKDIFDIVVNWMPKASRQ